MCLLHRVTSSSKVSPTFLNIQIQGLFKDFPSLILWNSRTRHGILWDTDRGLNTREFLQREPAERRLFTNFSICSCTKYIKSSTFNDIRSFFKNFQDQTWTQNIACFTCISVFDCFYVHDIADVLLTASYRHDGACVAEGCELASYLTPGARERYKKKKSYDGIREEVSFFSVLSQIWNFPLKL